MVSNRKQYRKAKNELTIFEIKWNSNYDLLVKYKKQIGVAYKKLVLEYSNTISQTTERNKRILTEEFKHHTLYQILRLKELSMTKYFKNLKLLKKFKH